VAATSMLFRHVDADLVTEAAAIVASMRGEARAD
jgi:hypothetical protein